MNLFRLAFLLMALVSCNAEEKSSKGEPVTHKYTNKLIDETSPYLLQHAHNPVNWYRWGKEAFEKAAKEDKPILLSIGYAACHWCHVMEHESFEDETTALLKTTDFKVKTVGYFFFLLFSLPPAFCYLLPYLTPFHQNMDSVNFSPPACLPNQ